MSTQKTLTFQPTGGDLAISTIQDWCITVSDDASTSEKYAAEEFQNGFNQATGLTLPVTAQDNPNADNGQIAIGALATLDAEAIQITVESGRVQIQGGLPRGVLYAVYQFLEELVGIRFLTAAHTHIPDASAVENPVWQLHLRATVFVPLELLP